MLEGLWKGDTDQARITARVDKPLVGANLQAHLDGLRKAMLKAAENLEFEEAARLRDEIKRLEAVDLAVADDPLARQSAIEAEVEATVAALEGRAGAGRGPTGARARSGCAEASREADGDLAMGNRGRFVAGPEAYITLPRIVISVTNPIQVAPVACICGSGRLRAFIRELRLAAAATTIERGGAKG